MSRITELNFMKVAGYYIQMTVYGAMFNGVVMELAETPQEMYIKKSEIVAFNDNVVITSSGFLFSIREPK